MKNNQEPKWFKYPTIEEQKEHFKSFSLLPLIIGVGIFVVCVLGGIGMAITQKSVGVFFAYAGGGIAGGALTYAILQIFISSQVLMVLYLEKISKDLEEIKNTSLESVLNPKNVSKNGTIQEKSMSIDNNVSVLNTSAEQEETSQHLQMDEKQKAIESFFNISEIQNNELFYNELKKWQDEYGNSLLYWNVNLYNQIVYFFNDNVCTVTYDSQESAKYTYQLNDVDCKNIASAIKLFCNLKLKK